MALTSDLNIASSNGFARAVDLRNVFGIVATLRKSLEQHRAYRTTLNELQSLSKRELNDLGLNGSMLHTNAYEAAYGGK